MDVPSWMCEVQPYTTESVMIELQYTPDWEFGDIGEAVTECEENGISPKKNGHNLIASFIQWVEKLFYVILAQSTPTYLRFSL